MPHSHSLHPQVQDALLTCPCWGPVLELPTCNQPAAKTGWSQIKVIGRKVVYSIRKKRPPRPTFYITLEEVSSAGYQPAGSNWLPISCRDLYFHCRFTGTAKRPHSSFAKNVFIFFWGVGESMGWRWSGEYEVSFLSIRTTQPIIAPPHTILSLHCLPHLFFFCIQYPSLSTTSPNRCLFKNLPCLNFA